MPSAAYKLQVTKPCHQAWNSMTDAGNGRHCGSCNKMVTDFSTLSDDEIKNYFLKNTKQPVCGRYKSSQLDRIKIHVPAYILRKPIPFWKKFLVVFLLCFGSHLYPFDTTVGNNPALYAQTIAAKKADKKANGKHKKKKKTLIKKNETSFDLSAFTMILGFTTMTPAPKTVGIADILVTKIISALGGPEDAEYSLADNQASKEYPDKKSPDYNTEAVLPAVPNYRRRKKAPAKSK